MKNFEGSIYKSKDHGWTGAVKNPRTGKRKVFYGKTRAEVKEKIVAFLDTVGKVDDSVASDSVEHFFISWLEDIRNTIKPKSYDAKDYIVRKFIIPELSNIQVGQITPADIQSVINDITERGYSYSVIHKIYNNLNQRFQLAVDRRELPFNPVTGVVLPKQLEKRKSDIRFFSESELKRIINAAERTNSHGNLIHRQGYAIRLLAYTGLRIGEALALQWSDINFADKKITVTKNIVTVVDRDGDKSTKAIVQHSTKTSSSNRVIPMSRNAEEALIGLKDSQPEGCEFVIATSSGTPADSKNIARMFDRIQTYAEIEPKGTLHSLRHTFATRLLAVGEDIKVVSSLLGHADINITYNTYIHIIEEQKAQAVAKIDLI